MVKATLSRLLSSEFHIAFKQMSGIENLLRPTDYTARNIYSRVRVENSAENSPCKVNVFRKGYTVLLNNEITFTIDQQGFAKAKA